MSPEVPIIILILAVPIFFLCKWTLQKRNLGNEKSRKYLAIIPTLFLSPLVYVGLILTWISASSYYPKVEFDQIQWRANLEERYKMSMDIIKSEILIGKSKEEVIEILGNDFSSDNGNQLEYDLGHVPGLLNIDPDFLIVYFLEGKVVKVEQHEG